MDLNTILYVAIILFILGMTLTIIGLVKDWYKSTNGWYKALFWISVSIWIISVILGAYWLMTRPKNVVKH